MGIIVNAKEYLAKKTADTETKAADRVAGAAVLSPQQVQRVNEKRTAYLDGRPDMQGDEAKAFIQHQLGVAGIEIYQA